MKNRLLTFEWREWFGLLALGILQIKAKVNTGARTSALHAFKLRPFMQEGIQCIEFRLHARHRDIETETVCTAEVVNQRTVMDSRGHKKEP